uniref:Cytochrome b/b6 C-terminal region profile domain-containing protein n=1 Tax=Lepeophtheirus salmonis TaxID=72036 RepID=A0A0K2UM74_LEPSM
MLRMLLNKNRIIAPNFFSLFGAKADLVPDNLFVTPAHIQPEWYFLIDYAI